MDKAKVQKSMETSKGLQDKSMDKAKAGSKIVKNEILEHLWSLFWLLSQEFISNPDAVRIGITNALEFHF